MTNEQVKEIEKETKDLFYKGRDLPQSYFVSVPTGDWIETGKPRPLPADQT